MLFNSLDFLVFFITVITTYYLIPHKFRWILLLAASYFFYGYWEVKYLGLIVISTLIDYTCGLQIAGSRTKGRKKAFLTISLLSNLGILGLFKYFNFFVTEANALIESLGFHSSIGTLSLLLPMGISFYTFQTMSYSIDVYKGKVEPERHLGIFALYVTFFPQLVAGPIERAGHLLAQFRTEKFFNYDDALSGISKILYGLFKKVVIADTLAIYVDMVYSDPLHQAGGALIIGTIFFAIQIYCDFSGYSDIAIGTARLLGFDLMENFRRPYLASSISDFWRRWHISLSTWFRDYVYIPLGGNRVSTGRWAFNLFLTFFISGIWHGANWTFLIWGAIHGVFIVIESVVLRIRPSGENEGLSLKKLGGMAVTLTVVVLAWVFFRANNLGDAMAVLSGMTKVFSGFSAAGLTAGMKMFPFALNFFLVFLLLLSYLLPIDLNLKRVNWLWVVLILVIIIFGQDGKDAFIYFQF